MKKVITLSALALITLFAKGQTEKNNWLMGGAIGFTSSTQKASDVSGSSKGTVFQLAPDIGYSLSTIWLQALALTLIQAIHLIPVPTEAIPLQVRILRQALLPGIILTQALM